MRNRETPIHNRGIEPDAKPTDSVKDAVIKRADIIKFAILIVILAGFTIVVVYYFPFFMSLRDPAIRSLWIEKIRGLGLYGVLVMLLLQIL